MLQLKFISLGQLQLVFYNDNCLLSQSFLLIFNPNSSWLYLRTQIRDASSSSEIFLFLYFRSVLGQAGLVLVESLFFFDPQTYIPIRDGLFYKCRVCLTIWMARYSWKGILSTPNSRQNGAMSLKFLFSTGVPIFPAPCTHP